MANTIEGFSGAVIAFVILAVIIGIGGSIMSEIAEDQCNEAGNYWNTTAPYSGDCQENASAGGAIPGDKSISFNASEGGIEGIETFGDWLPTIAVILAAALVIGIITAYFYMRG